ncbi:serine hydrolase domain-containing protein [Arsenicibacter rosenii]|uniref:Serine hydrolase n=1 Tax=Arsenicibacter rosenii TaxID=1750698 RepID=A0A1S2VBH1_9BACT|nr:serine hydrolase [Arsenicibacter rosenii]OIN55770.1 serine hydrolase [Arsenicibacter rosenii]
MQSRIYHILFALLFAGVAVAQSPEFVSTQGITADIHRANVGKISFTDQDIPLASLRESDFLHQYTLTNKSNLFMTVFMGTSLTNYMHRIAPDLPADSLTKNGGYQFTFFVDGRQIYQSNLHPGAPYARIKNTETLIRKPLIDNQHEGAWWSQSAWGRFIYNGGDQALTDGPHVFRLDIRAYVNYARPVVGELIASGELRLDVNRKPVINVAAVRLTAPKPYAGLPVSGELFDTDKIKVLKGNIDAGVFRNITSVVVLQNGKILIEEYFNGATRDSLHDVRSVGKSFASALTGIALQDGYLKSVEQPLSAFYNLKQYANYSQAKADTRLAELLTMSSAFDGDDSDDSSPGNEENMYPTPDWIKFALDLPVLPQKFGGKWHYFTTGVVLLGDVLNKSVPGQLEQYANRKLFGPLGITTHQWSYTPQKAVSMAGGIRMKALDFAKFGQLYKNNGRWNGRQVLPAAWVQQSFQHHKPLPDRPDEFYGYLFWNKTYQVQGKAYETYYCTGNGGNKIFVFRDQPLVVVVTARAYNQYYAHPQVDRIMEAFVLPAVFLKSERVKE